MQESWGVCKIFFNNETNTWKYENLFSNLNFILLCITIKKSVGKHIFKTGAPFIHVDGGPWL